MTWCGASSAAYPAGAAVPSCSNLLEQALQPDQSDDDPLYQAALAVERDMRLAGEMTKWEAATIGDGFTVAPWRKPHR